MKIIIKKMIQTFKIFNNKIMMLLIKKYNPKILYKTLNFQEKEIKLNLKMPLI